MAAIKSYTDLEQSKKLVEILPLESVDMCYPLPCEEGDKPLLEQEGFGSTPCWSLAALFGVLPNDISLLHFDNTYQMVYDKKPYVISNKFDNPIDSCVDMVIKLSELKLL